MPFTSGVFANVSGATSASTGQIVQSSVWNAIHADYSAALNEVANQLMSTTTYKNVLWMNGGLEVWQRNTSVSIAASTTAYTSDRWYLDTDANQASVVSRQTGLTNKSSYCARIQRTAAETGVGEVVFGYPLDTDELIRLRGSLCAISITLRAGANWSPASGAITVGFRTGTGAVGKRGTGPFTNETDVIEQAANITTTATVYNYTSAAIVPTNITQAELSLTWTPVGTAGASDYFEIDDVQLISVAASAAADYIPDDFEVLPLNIMIDGCKRHYYKSFAYDSVVGYDTIDIPNSIKAWAQAAEIVGIFSIFPVSLRTAPDTTRYPIASVSASGFIGINVSASYGGLNTTAGVNGILVYSSVSVSTANAAYAIHIVASAGI